MYPNIHLAKILEATALNTYDKSSLSLDLRPIKFWKGAGFVSLYYYTANIGFVLFRLRSKNESCRILMAYSFSVSFIFPYASRPIL